MSDASRGSKFPEGKNVLSGAARGSELPKGGDALSDVSRGSTFPEGRDALTDASRGAESSEGRGVPAGASSPSELREQSKGLRGRAAQFDQRLDDPQAKRFIQTHEVHHLMHGDRFLDTDATSRPTEMCEAIWLDSAKEMLRISEENFATFEREVERHFSSRVEAVKLIDGDDLARRVRRS